jgi:hypothetical protein
MNLQPASSCDNCGAALLRVVGPGPHDVFLPDRDVRTMAKDEVGRDECPHCGARWALEDAP